MTRQELTKTIRAHKGTIYAAVIGNNDCHYIRVMKNDLLAVVADLPDNELEAKKHSSGDLYIDRAG